MCGTHEVNFDGLIGPTHNYAGLSYGNIASMSHKQSISNPRQAALQGLAKMKLLMDLGVKQAILPPHERPHIPTLRRLGFSGSDVQILEKAHRSDPVLLAAVSSASSMWAANAATVSPSADTADGRVHFTPANLISQFHRSIETPTTTRILKKIFADESAFAVHDPLPAAVHFSDEGAANHMRLCSAHGEPGIEIFVYGRSDFEPSSASPTKYPARQTLEASAAIARRHLLNPQRVVCLRQNPSAIDAGAFHNDVVAVANQNVMLYQQDAYSDPAWPLNPNAYPSQQGLYLTSPDITFADAIQSYLFNSQLLTLPDNGMALICPVECQQVSSVQNYLEAITNSGAIKQVHYIDVRESMHNGGGPACLRLRVVLTENEIKKVRGNVLLTDSLYAQLAAWIQKHYRESLSADDLRDPQLVIESRTALDELTNLLQLRSLYEFQTASGD